MTMHRNTDSGQLTPHVLIWEQFDEVFIVTERNYNLWPFTNALLVQEHRQSVGTSPVERRCYLRAFLGF